MGRLQHQFQVQAAPTALLSKQMVPTMALRLLFGECSGPFGARAYSTLGHHVLASFRAVPCSLPALPGAVEAWKFSKILASRVAIAIRKRITALQACKTGRPAAHVSCSPVSFPTFRKRTRLVSCNWQSAFTVNKAFCALPQRCWHMAQATPPPPPPGARRPWRCRARIVSSGRDSALSHASDAP